MSEMKNKKQFVASIILMICGLIIPMALLFYNLYLPMILSYLIFPFAIFVLVDWQTKNYEWICGKCGHQFSITRKENFLGRNGGLNMKLLYCEKCGKKVWCRSVSK